MPGAGDADGRAAMRAALVPASGRRGLVRVGEVIDRAGDPGALRRTPRIAEMFLAANPHLVGVSFALALGIARRG